MDRINYMTRQEKIEYIDQFISVRRFSLTDRELDKLIIFVDKRDQLNGKTKINTGIETKKWSSDGRYDERIDHEITYVFDQTGVYFIDLQKVFWDGIEESCERIEIRNVRQILIWVDWIQR